MTTLSDTVYFISVENLYSAFEKGFFNYCRPEFYIRQSVNEDSVEEKKKALVSIVDKNKSEGTIKILEPIVLNCFQKKDPAIEGDIDHEEIISGNTRIRAVLALYEQQIAIPDGSPLIVNTGSEKEPLNITITDFELIPFRRFEDSITLEEAIDFQTSTNDFTQKHSPYDVAMKIHQLRPVLERRFGMTPKNQKKVGGTVTDYLCRTFKRSKQNLSQYKIVLENGTPLLNEYVKTGRIIMDTASVLVSGLAKRGITTEGESNKILEQLWRDAETEAQANKKISDELKKGKDTDIKDDAKIAIYKSAVLRYFADLDLVTDVTTDVTTDAPTDVTTDVSDPVYTKEKFLEDVQIASHSISQIGGAEYNLEQIKIVRDYNMGVLSFLEETHNYLGDSETTKDMNHHLSKALAVVMGNIEYVVHEVNNADNTKFKKLAKALSKITKPVNDLAKSFEPAPVTPAPIEYPASEDIVMETEQHLVTVI